MLKAKIGNIFKKMELSPLFGSLLVRNFGFNKSHWFASGYQEFLVDKTIFRRGKAIFWCRNFESLGFWGAIELEDFFGKVKVNCTCKVFK
jgi:hypothetical protein